MKKENAKKLSLSKIKIANLSQENAKGKDVSPTTTVLLSRKNLC
jgi:hypothetical protein